MSRSLVVKNKEKVKEANILAVVFDFDDTLVCPPIEWQQVMAEFFVDNINENYVSIVKREEQVARYKKYIANNAGLTLTKYMVKLQQLIQKKRRYGVRTVVYYREKFDELWRSETVNYYTPKDLVMGVRSLLLQLMKNGIKIFVVTGGDRAHKVNLIKKLNLEKLFALKIFLVIMTKDSHTDFRRSLHCNILGMRLQKKMRSIFVQRNQSFA